MKICRWFRKKKIREPNYNTVIEKPIVHNYRFITIVQHGRHFHTLSKMVNSLEEAKYIIDKELDSDW